MLTTLLIDPYHKRLGMSTVFGKLLQTLDEAVDLLHTCKMLG